MTLAQAVYGWLVVNGFLLIALGCGLLMADAVRFVRHHAEQRRTIRRLLHEVAGAR